LKNSTSNGAEELKIEKALRHARAKDEKIKKTELRSGAKQ